VTSSRLSTIQVLSVFVICERRRGCLSPWKVYIDSLPTQHTVPLFWTDAILSLLPTDVRRAASQSATELSDSYHRLIGLFDAISAAFPGMFADPFTIVEYQWASTCVNTRCIHLAGNKHSDTASDDDIALAPLLDMFNHSPDVQVCHSFRMTLCTGGTSNLEMPCVVCEVFQSSRNKIQLSSKYVYL